MLCNIDVDAGAGERQIVMVERYLVQLGFGVPAGMPKLGSEVEVGITMVKMVAKMSTGRGWVAGPHPGGVLMAHLEKWVDQHAIDMVQAREDGSCIFYVNDLFVEALLRVSGHGGVFIKCHADEGRPLMELLWLDAGVSWRERWSI